MPGIIGTIKRRSNDLLANDLHTMTKCMLHEPFYSLRTYIDSQIGVQIACISHDNSFNCQMPIWNDERNYLIIFAGDYFVDSIIYNEQKAKHGGIQLDKANYLIWLYEEHGDDFIKMLNGWFSGVLIDLRSKKIILFNDRYGQGRIYY